MSRRNNIYIAIIEQVKREVDDYFQHFATSEIVRQGFTTLQDDLQNILRIMTMSMIQRLDTLLQKDFAYSVAHAVTAHTVQQFFEKHAQLQHSTIVSAILLLTLLDITFCAVRDTVGIDFKNALEMTAFFGPIELDNNNRPLIPNITEFILKGFRPDNKLGFSTEHLSPIFWLKMSILYAENLAAIKKDSDASMQQHLNTMKSFMLSNMLILEPSSSPSLSTEKTIDEELNRDFQLNKLSNLSTELEFPTMHLIINDLLAISALLNEMQSLFLLKAFGNKLANLATAKQFRKDLAEGAHIVSNDIRDLKYTAETYSPNEFVHIKLITIFQHVYAILASSLLHMSRYLVNTDMHMTEVITRPSTSNPTPTYDRQIMQMIHEIFATAKRIIPVHRVGRNEYDIVYARDRAASSLSRLEYPKHAEWLLKLKSKIRHVLEHGYPAGQTTCAFARYTYSFIQDKSDASALEDGWQRQCSRRVFAYAYCLSRLFESIPSVAFLMTLKDNPDTKELRQSVKKSIFYKDSTSGAEKKWSTTFYELFLSTGMNDDKPSDQMVAIIDAFLRDESRYSHVLLNTLQQKTGELYERLKEKPSKVIGYVKIGNRGQWSRRFNVSRSEQDAKSFKISCYGMPIPLHKWFTYENSVGQRVSLDLMYDPTEKMEYDNKNEALNKVFGLEAGTPGRPQLIERPEMETVEGGMDLDYVFGPFQQLFVDPKTTPEDMAKECTDVVRLLTDGQSVMVFGFGVSGAGKTSTLIRYTGATTTAPGLMEKWYDQFVNEQKDNLESIQILVTEVYLDQMNATATPPAMKLITNVVEQVEIGGDVGKIMDQIIWFIDNQRVISPTSNNPLSSRSHVLVSIVFFKKGNKQVCLHIADLAGSENEFNAKDDAQRQRFEALLRTSDKRVTELLRRTYGNGVKNPLNSMTIEQLEDTNRANILGTEIDWNRYIVKKDSRTYDTLDIILLNQKVASIFLHDLIKLRPPLFRIVKNLNINLVNQLTLVEKVLHAEPPTTSLDVALLNKDEASKGKILSAISSIFKILHQNYFAQGITETETEAEAVTTTAMNAFQSFTKGELDSLQMLLKQYKDNFVMMGAKLFYFLWWANTLYLKFEYDNTDAKFYYACLFTLLAMNQNLSKTANGAPTYSYTDFDVAYKKDGMTVFDSAHRYKYQQKPVFHRHYMFKEKTPSINVDVLLNVMTHVFSISGDEQKQVWRNAFPVFRKFVSISSESPHRGDASASGTRAALKKPAPVSSPPLTSTFGPKQEPMPINKPKTLPTATTGSFQTDVSNKALTLVFHACSMMSTLGTAFAEIVTNYMDHCTNEGRLINHELEQIKRDLVVSVQTTLNRENPDAKPYVHPSCAQTMMHPLLGDRFDASKAPGDATSKSIIFNIAYALSSNKDQALDLLMGSSSAVNPQEWYRGFVNKVYAEFTGGRTYDFKRNPLYIQPVILCVMNLDASIKDPPTPFLDVAPVRYGYELLSALIDAQTSPAAYLDVETLCALGVIDSHFVYDAINMMKSGKIKESTEELLQKGFLNLNKVGGLSKMSMLTRILDSYVKPAMNDIAGTAFLYAENETQSIFSKILQYRDSIMAMLTNPNKIVKAKSGVHDFINLIEKFSAKSIIGNTAYVDMMVKYGSPASCFIPYNSERCPVSTNPWNHLLENMQSLRKIPDDSSSSKITTVEDFQAIAARYKSVIKGPSTQGGTVAAAAKA
jgi:Kinesin motor domain